MFKAAAIMLFCKNWPLPPPRCQLLTVIKTFSRSTAVEIFLLRISLVLVFFTESCNFKGQTIFSLGNDPLFLLLQSHVVFNGEIELNQILKTQFFSNSVNLSENILLFPEGTVWEHKPLLLLTKSLRWTSRISVLFIVMSCYHENECFQFMLRALSALH